MTYAELEQSLESANPRGAQDHQSADGSGA